MSGDMVWLEDYTHQTFVPDVRITEDSPENIYLRQRGYMGSLAVARTGQGVIGWIDTRTLGFESAREWFHRWIRKEAALTVARELCERANDYLILDEDDFSELEDEDANETWANCFDAKERIAYIADHRSQFEFHDLADMLGCVRGKYFAGYAGELLNR